MAGLDVDAMLKRYQERAVAVKKRNLPPVGGDERQAFIKQAEQDFMDFSIVGDATWTFDDGVLTLTVDFNPPAED